MKTYKISGIKYDTDGISIDDLPEEMTVKAADEQNAIDAVSDIAGWLVVSVEKIEAL